VDIESVHQACAPLTARTRARASTGAADVRGPCRRLGPECRAQRNLWDFDTFLKDDTGRMMSTKTPVAKMTAPISMMKEFRIDHARQQNAAGSDAKAPSGKSENDKQVGDGHASGTVENNQAGGVGKNNSSNKSKRLAADLTTPPPPSVFKSAGVDGARRNSRRNSSPEKLKDDVRGGKQRANRLDENNSSNTAKTTTDAAGIRDPAGRWSFSQSDTNNSSSQAEDDHEEPVEELNLPKAELERAESLSAFQPGEKRRRSPSLQVLMHS